MAGHEVAAAEVEHRGLLLGADVQGEAAARREPAAGRRRGHVRRPTRDRLQPGVRREVHPRCRPQQRRGVAVLHVREQLRVGAISENLPAYITATRSV